MQLHSMKLVSIVAESVLKDHLLQKVVDAGATGYTCHEATGAGSRGARTGLPNDNVRVDIICSPDVADAVLTAVSHSFFENYACIAWVTDVAVVQGVHYQK